MLIFDRLALGLRQLLRRRQAGRRTWRKRCAFIWSSARADYAADGLRDDEARLARTAALRQPRESPGAVPRRLGLERVGAGVEGRGLRLSPPDSITGFLGARGQSPWVSVKRQHRVFSVLNSIMLRPLPYAKSAELDSIVRSTPQAPEGGVSPADKSSAATPAITARSPPMPPPMSVSPNPDNRRRWCPQPA
ncbi:MAG: hypothetical protein U1F61_03395 [Opitutaceae bacterium]